MTALNIQAAQNDIIRQVLNTQDIHLLDRIRNLFANKEANEACMVQEEPCMTKEDIRVTSKSVWIRHRSSLV